MMMMVVTVRMGRPRWRVDDKGADVGAGGSKDDFGMRPAAGEADQTPAVVYVPDEEGIARRIGRRNQHGYLPIPRSATHRACEPW